VAVANRAISASNADSLQHILELASSLGLDTLPIISALQRIRQTEMLRNMLLEAGVRCALDV
jgi:hypothetical protein